MLFTSAAIAFSANHGVDKRLTTTDVANVTTQQCGSGPAAKAWWYTHLLHNIAYSVLHDLPKAAAIGKKCTHN